MARSARLSQQIHTVSDELGIIEGNVMALASRVQSLERDRYRTEEAIQAARHRLDASQTHMRNIDASNAGLELKVQAAEWRAAAAEVRADAAEQMANSTQDQLTELVHVLGSIFGLW